MNELTTTEKILLWITLLLGLIFLGLGLGIISGAFFADRAFLTGTMKYVLGAILVGYGIFRVITVGRKIIGKKGNERLQKKLDFDD